MTGRFANELEFQRWLLERFNVQRWHPTLIPDSPQHPGLPDLNACHLIGLEVWAEVKYARKPQDIHGKTMRLDHPLTPQQRSWLMTHDKWSGPMTKCVVMVGWCTNAGEYLTAVPIDEWDEWIQNPVMAWGLCKYTIGIHHVDSGRADMVQLLTAGFPPGSLPPG